MKREDLSVIQHARKSLLFNKEIQWQKKNTSLFDVAMVAYNEAEVCELVCFFLLNNFENKFDKNSVGLYIDDGLALFKNINSYCAEKIHKEFNQLFKKSVLPTEIECNLNTVKYLDITLDLNTDT